MLFPMYTMPSERLLQMTVIEPHEVLKARGDIVVFSASMGKAAFVSHQWAAKHHPDPELKQFRVLQGALRHMLGGLGFIPLDPVTEALVPTAQCLPLHEFRSQPVFFWYDYISCPQMECAGRSDACTAGDLRQAIHSIPGYIARCSFFFGLCPVIDTSDGKVLTPASWTQRAWCRFERALRELSRDETWILIKSETSLEVVGSALAFLGGSAGEGQFTQQGDRDKLGPVLREAVLRKLALCLRLGDFAAYRRHLNLQGVYFRGLKVQPVQGLIPIPASNLGESADHPLVAEFFLQNGFTKPRDLDDAGWSVLHYATLSGNTNLVSCLLQLRAEPNRRTSRDQPNLGCPRWTSALDLAMLFKQNDVAGLLIAARAKLEGGVLQAMHFAAIADNAAGIRLLCAAGADPLAKDLLGTPAVCTAAGYGAMEALEELVLRANHEPSIMSRALCMAAGGGGSSAEMVGRLIELKADVDYQNETKFLSLAFLLVTVKSLQHRFGRGTSLSALFYHWAGMTPLMAALLAAQHEGAAALVAAGARLDLRNCRNRTADDFAQNQSLPGCLLRGLAGDPSDCQRLVSLAVADACLEI